MRALAAALATAAAAAVATAPSQIHAHFAADGARAVSWAVPTSCGAACAAVVAYSTVTNDTSAAGLWAISVSTSAAYLDASVSATPWTVLTAVLPSLPPSSTVHYVVGGLGSGAPVYALAPAMRPASAPPPSALPPDYAGPPLRVAAAFADFGLTHAYSLPRLLSDAAAGAFDTVLFAGDLAYDLWAAGGATGDAFMSALEPALATAPTVVAAGNHECDTSARASGGPLACFASYGGRFAGVGATAGAASGSGNAFWYSVDDVLAGVHYVVVNSELWNYTGSAANVTQQTEWLQADLLAVDRAVTPWVVALSHKTVRRQ